MKEIKLTKGYVTQIDDEDFEWLSQWKWQVVVRNGCTSYAKRGVQNKTTKKIITIQMHRQIMDTPSNMQVDHIDGNGLNNQKHNLRNCSSAENRKNRRLGKNNKVGFKGVYEFRNKVFVSKIYANKVLIYLGLFKTATMAAIAYDEAAMKYHGEFARLNFPTFIKTEMKT